MNHKLKYATHHACFLALESEVIKCTCVCVCVHICSCKYNLEELWSTSLRGSALTATPLLFDVDGDGWRDVVAPSYSGEVWAVHGENGHVVDGWPFYLDQRGFHASPLVVSKTAHTHTHTHTHTCHIILWP